MFAEPRALRVGANRLPKDARVDRWGLDEQVCSCDEPDGTRTVSSIRRTIILWITSATFKDDDPVDLPPVSFVAVDKEVKTIEVAWEHRFIVMEALTMLGFNVSATGVDPRCPERSEYAFRKARVQVEPANPKAAIETEHLRFEHSWRPGSLVCDCGNPACMVPADFRPPEMTPEEIAEVARIRALPRDQMNRPIEIGEPPQPTPEQETEAWRVAELLTKPIRFREFL
jgi:hypothetical protein